MNPRRSIARRSLACEGFSLVEISTALFILVVGLFGVFQLFHFGLGKLRALDESAIAMQAVQNELETVRATPFAQLQDGEHEFVTQDPALERLVKPTGTVTIVTVADPAGLKQVDISLRWVTQNGRVADRAVTTYVGDKGS